MDGLHFPDAHGLHEQKEEEIIEQNGSSFMKEEDEDRWWGRQKSETIKMFILQSLKNVSISVFIMKSYNL